MSNPCQHPNYCKDFNHCPQCGAEDLLPEDW